MSNPAPGYVRHPDHVVAISPGDDHLRVFAGDRLVADSRSALRVEESRHSTVWYFPPEDVEMDLLEATDSHSYCPFKGNASYYSIVAGEQRLADAVWCYREPYDECSALAGCLAFYPDRVRLEVNGAPQG